MPSQIRNLNGVSIGDIIIWEMGSFYQFGHAGIVAGVYTDQSGNEFISILHAVGQHPDFRTDPHNVIFSLANINPLLLGTSKVRFYSNTYISGQPHTDLLSALHDHAINRPDGNPTTRRIFEQMPILVASKSQIQLITNALKIKNTGGEPTYYSPRIAQVVTGLPCFGTRAQKRLEKYYNRLQQTNISMPIVAAPEPSADIPLSVDDLGSSTTTSATALSPTSTTSVLSPVTYSSDHSPVRAAIESTSQSQPLPIPQTVERPIVRHLTCTEFVILTYQLTFYNKSQSSGNMFIYRDARNTSPTGLARYLESTPGWVKYKLIRTPTASPVAPIQRTEASHFSAI